MMAARHAWSGVFSRESAGATAGRAANPALLTRCGTGIQPRAADPPETRTPRRARSSAGA